jgi:hypothetical protein
MKEATVKGPPRAARREAAGIATSDPRIITLERAYTASSTARPPDAHSASVARPASLGPSIA